MEVIEIKFFLVKTCTPNPSSNKNDLTVDYEVSSANSAYLFVTNVLNNGRSNYNSNLTNNTVQPPLTNLTPGNYQIYLVGKVVIQDSKPITIY
ncbi:MAG: hypothetical protein ACI91R_001289 [Vicingaceae bacterium]|jgi:hypothetical protein